MREEPGTRPDFNFIKSLKQGREFRLPKVVQVDRYINRPLASLIARAALKANLTPNQLTAASFVLGVGGSLFYLWGNSKGFALAGCLIYASTLFDGADGMLARSLGMCTRFGAYLDLFVDRVTDFAVFGTMAVGYYKYSGRIGLLILSLLALGAFMLQTMLYYLEREYLRIHSGSGADGDYRGLLYLAILVFSLVNRLDIFIAIIITFPALDIGYRFVHFLTAEKPEEPPQKAQ